MKERSEGGVWRWCRSLLRQVHFGARAEGMLFCHRAWLAARCADDFVRPRTLRDEVTACSAVAASRNRPPYSRGFCKSSAGRRIAAARVCRSYPEAFSRVAMGELQLSVLSVLAQHLNPENATEVFEACSNKSYEQVELLLAARFPKPDVRELIRRLPSREQPITPHMGSAAQTLPVAQIPPDPPGLGLLVALTPPDPPGPGLPVEPASQPPPRARIEPLSADRFGVHFTADIEFRALLEEVRALASHAEPKGELLPLMKRALQAYRSELQKTRFGVGRRSRRARSAESVLNAAANQPSPVADSTARAAKRPRHVPAEVSREVYARDGGCCTFESDDGRRCGARKFLELDHIQPWAKGGESTAGNLRLRCRGHNQHAARAHFGEDLIREAIAGTRIARASRRDGPRPRAAGFGAAAGLEGHGRPELRSSEDDRPCSAVTRRGAHKKARAAP